MKKPFKNSSDFDDLYTPESAVAPIIQTVFRNILGTKLPRVWEPCDPGGSNITKVLQWEGFEVVSTDIKTGVDFLKISPAEVPSKVDLIVTNPPYSIKDKFIRKAFDLGYPFAFLLPLDALAGKYRSELYAKYRVSINIFDTRIDFTGNKRPWFYNFWLTWKIQEPNTVNWVKYREEK